MEKRVISTQIQEEDLKIEKSLRPQTLSEYIGWKFCAMGFLNMGELRDYPVSEMYNRLMQQPDCEMQDYPLSVLAGIGHIRCSEGFASALHLFSRYAVHINFKVGHEPGKIRVGRQFTQKGIVHPPAFQ